MNSELRCCLLLAAACLLLSCSRQPTANFAPRKLAAEHLPNVWQIHAKVISGGLPEGDAAFAELVRLGVKTVISVDGAKPEVERARRHGLRYVHLPHGYDGVPEQRGMELAKAVRDLPGPIYIHCHHGKHRSPAAAAVACVGAGLLDSAAAPAVLLAAGTSQAYQGLYQSARDARRFENTLLNAFQADFPETAAIPPLAEAMVALEQTHDHLREFAAAGWQPPASHPDLDPAHEALLLREHITELLRTEAVHAKPDDFQDLLRDSESAAVELEAVLRASHPTGTRRAPPALPEPLLKRITANCQACHAKHRDVPLSQKSR
jgi:protein tyrosine phosphatase (PTP) superfamily phosphohydrolase (DUF442 family)